jgi:hypothetical protein
MLGTVRGRDVWVCTDCYFAHHFGAHEHEGQWFAGESVIAADREPLALLEGFELADNTDAETGEGTQDFSWSTCEGCGSTLGGSRDRLSTWKVAPWRLEPLGINGEPSAREYDL